MITCTPPTGISCLKGHSPRWGARDGSTSWRTWASKATVLYPSNGLAFGRVVSRDWAIELARAYNDWIHDEYTGRSPRFQAVGLIPLHEPEAAVAELRRIVEELHFAGAMLPGTGAKQLQNHLGDERYWPIYEEADRLGCALGIHGGVHDNMGLDDMSPSRAGERPGAPLRADGQFRAASSSTASSTVTPTPGFGFLEAGAAWFVNCLERFERSWSSHIQYDPNGRFLKLRDKESVTDYVLKHVDAGRIFVGVEGDELTLPLRRPYRRQQAVPLLFRFPPRSEQRHRQGRDPRAAGESPAHG